MKLPGQRGACAEFHRKPEIFSTCLIVPSDGEAWSKDYGVQVQIEIESAVQIRTHPCIRHDAEERADFEKTDRWRPWLGEFVFQAELDSAMPIALYVEHSGRYRQMIGP